MEGRVEGSILLRSAKKNEKIAENFIVFGGFFSIVGGSVNGFAAPTG